MATTHGKGGVLKVGANTIGEVRSFEITETAEVAADTAMGDTWTTHNVGMSSWEASVTCWWDADDSTGQEALTVGSSVTFNAFPEGDSSGDRTGTGTATVVSVSLPQDVGENVERSFGLQGNGAWAWSDVA